MKQLNLTPDEAKSLADYPIITRTYGQCHDMYLFIHLRDFEKRRLKLTPSDWERKFCHLHIEAINLEILKRQLA